MTRPIGPAVISAVEHLERMGQACYIAGRPPKGEVRRDRSSRELRRAVQYGMVCRSEEKPYVYRAVPGWRDMLNAPARLKCGRVSSVWDLAKGTV